MTEAKQPSTITDELEEALGDAAPAVQEAYDEFYEWMLEKGNNPRREIGLSEGTAGNYMDRLDLFHRFSITYLEPSDRTTIDGSDAHTLLHRIDRGEITKRRSGDEGGEYGESAKRKFSDAVQKYFEWRYHDGSMEYEWRPKINFSDGRSESAYRFTYRELGLLLEAAESYGSLPSYYDTTEEERDRINGLVAQRLGLPKEDVTRNDWLHADWSSKIHSLVTVGYDAGLAPIEIANAETSWYDPQTKTLTIPTEYACKQREKQVVALSDESADANSEWMRERRHLEAYDGKSKLWLNREGNPYQSGSLCNIIRDLCAEASVKTDGRKVVWYSLRQTMGRNVTEGGELSESNDQLRRNNLETTHENYNQTPVEKLQARLNSTRQKAERAAADPEYNPFEEDQPGHGSPRSASSRQSTRESNELADAVTTTDSGRVHTDIEIENTTTARAEIARQLLDDGGDD